MTPGWRERYGLLPSSAIGSASMSARKAMTGAREARAGAMEVTTPRLPRASR